MPATILVVEDEALILDMVTLALELEGYAVLRATNGAAPLALLEGGGIDLLLTDELMPGLRGLELIAHLRAHPDLAMPVILMSAIRPGPIPPGVAFLPKPFDIDRFLALVAGLLAAP